MGGAILLSVVAHALVMLAFVEVSRDRQAALVAPVEQPEQPAIEVEILADPRTGIPDADGTAAADQAAIPPAAPPAEQATPPTDVPDAAPAPPPSPPPEEAALPPTPAPPEPEPPVPEPPRQPPPPTRATTTPAPRPAPPARMRAGSGAEGRADGTTDIVLGNNTVPAGPDPAGYNLPPRYPREAAQRGQQGIVRLSVVVATDGTALSVDIAESSGHPLLDRTAREAVAKWRFRPGRDGGLAVPSTIPVTLSFILEERR